MYRVWRPILGINIAKIVAAVVSTGPIILALVWMNHYYNGSN
jgi:hypothetical protein